MKTGKSLKALETPKVISSRPLSAGALKADLTIKVKKHAVERDEFGFSLTSGSSFIVSLLEAGKYTKEQMLEQYLKHFTIDDTPGEARRKKVTFSVFLSDVKRPFGCYNASRSLIIHINDKGIFSLEPNRAAFVKKAITKGVLEELKGLSSKKHADKIEAILIKYKLPTEYKAGE